jgi:hypothetical protein
MKQTKVPLDERLSFLPFHLAAGPEGNVEEPAENKGIVIPDSNRTNTRRV